MEEGRPVTIKGKFVGKFYPVSNMFVKDVKKSVHWLWKTDEWAHDAEHFTKELLPKNTIIVLREVEEKVVYKAPAQDWKDQGRWTHHKKDGIDYGAQVCLKTARFWTKRVGQTDWTPPKPEEELPTLDLPDTKEKKKKGKREAHIYRCEFCNKETFESLTSCVRCKEFKNQKQSYKHRLCWDCFIKITAEIHDAKVKL
jgi:hypothetical protein